MPILLKLKQPPKNNLTSQVSYDSSYLKQHELFFLHKTKTYNGMICISQNFSANSLSFLRHQARNSGT